MKKELGKWLMDIAKYVATAVILSSIFTGLDDTYIVIAIGLCTMFVALIAGLWLVDEPKAKKKRSK